MFSSHWRNETPIRQGLACGIFILCAYSAWLGGGVPRAVQWPLPMLAALLLAVLPFLPEDAFRRVRARIIRDRVFHFGIGFLLLLFIQWINSGDGAIRSSWVPWSENRDGAGEMLNFFFPALVALLLVRNVLERPDLKLLLHLMIWNGTILAMTGMIQYLSDADRIFGIWYPDRSDFFATFAYPNHAAVWFYLHAAFSAGLAHDAQIKRKPRIRTLIWGGGFLSCIIATFLTLSRLGSLIAVVQMSAACFVLFHWTRNAFRGARALNAYLGLALFALMGAALFFGAGGGDLAREVAGKPMFGQRSLVNDLSLRAGHVSAAAQRIVDYPLFGCGGGGCDALVEQVVPQERRRSWKVGERVHVHCEPIQFLFEFGIAGMICLGGACAVLLSDLLKARKNALLWWGSGGLAAAAFHGLIDIPFRSPAILLAWCILFALIPRLMHRSSPAAG